MDQESLPPLVVVMPDGGGESWFVDNTDPDGAGKVETALSTDLVEAVDTTLPTAAFCVALTTPVSA